jgi:ATP-binding cassette subfamily G (WHITE) protein 2
MKKGEIAYQGAADKSIAFFETAGFPCPALTNPADHLLDVVSISDSSEQADGEGRLGKQLVPLDMEYGLEKDSFAAKLSINWFNQFYILMQRNLQEKVRRWDLLFYNILITLIVATFVGQGGWNAMGTNQTGLAKRNPLLFFCVIHQGVVSTLQGTYSFPVDRALMLRERAAGSYYISAYYLAKSLADMLIQTITPLTWTLIV